MRLALGLWIAVAVAVAVRTLHRPEKHTVFPVLAAGASHWWADQQLYAKYESLDYFRYPPALAIALTPFAGCGHRAGGVLWAWTNLAVYFVGLRRCLRDVLPGHMAGSEAAFLILSGIGALSGIWNAQSNALMVGLLLLGASALVRQRWWAAAVFLGLPVALKLTPLPLALLCCALWPRQLAGRLLCVTAAGLLVPFLTRPPAVVCWQYQGWAAHLVGMSAERWPGFRDGWTVWALARHWLDGGTGLPNLREPLDGVWYRGVQVIGGLTVLACCLWLRRRGVPARPLATLTLALGSGWLMLLGPAVEHPTFAFLAPWLAWAFLCRHEWPAGKRLIEASAACVLLLGWGSLTRPLWGVAPWLIAALPAGTALFLTWATGRARAEATRGGGIRFARAGGGDKMPPTYVTLVPPRESHDLARPHHR